MILNMEKLLLNQLQLANYYLKQLIMDSKRKISFRKNVEIFAKIISLIVPFNLMQAAKLTAIMWIATAPLKPKVL